ncbi:MAG: amidohydrolase [Oscillospiraceae bacterium]|nr:amidohydrolase [Oscillospiraceae bacterium]
MKFIDFHTHVYPDAIAPKAANSIREFYSLGNDTMDGTVKMLLEKGAAAGTWRYVILPVAMRPDRTRHINDFILETLAQEPTFFGFGTVHAAMAHLMDEVAYIRQKGLRGIKMHPDSQVFAIDDERLFPMYEDIQGELPVILHMGDHRFDYSHPARLRHLLQLFPKLQVIAAHFGGYELYREAYDLLKDTDCFFDVSSSLMFMEEGEAERYINRYGAERFVYGSDYPMWNPVEEMQRFLQLKLTDEQQEQIAHKTAERILNL